MDYYRLKSKRSTFTAGQLLSRVIESYVTENESTHNRYDEVRINISEQVIEFRNSKLHSETVQFGAKGEDRKPAMVVEFSDKTFNDIARMWLESDADE